jgi:hypothetical protein
MVMSGTVREVYEDGDLLVHHNLWITARYTPVPDMNAENAVMKLPGAADEPGPPHFFAEVSAWTIEAARAAVEAAVIR